MTARNKKVTGLSQDQRFYIRTGMEKEMGLLLNMKAGLEKQLTDVNSKLDAHRKAYIHLGFDKDMRKEEDESKRRASGFVKSWTLKKKVMFVLERYFPQGATAAKIYDKLEELQAGINTTVYKIKQCGYNSTNDISHEGTGVYRIFKLKLQP